MDRTIETDVPICRGTGLSDQDVAGGPGRSPATSDCRTQVAKLLFVIDQYANVFGGTEQHILFLCRNLPQTHVKSRLVVMTKMYREDASVFQIPVEVLGGTFSGGRGFVQHVRRLARQIVRDGIDLVHAFCPTSELASLLATRWARRGRVIGSRRNVGYRHSHFSLWRTRATARMAAHYVANCEAAKRFSVAHEWILPSRVSVIHNPIDWQRRAEGFANPIDRAELGIVDGQRVVVMVANVRPVKDYETYFRAAQLVIRQHPNTRFLVVGGYWPAYHREMVQLIETLGIVGNVSWVGQIPNPYRVLAHADVGVLSSTSEGFSNALLEYAAAGIPAVATSVGGSPELVRDGETGFLVPPRTPELMADRINRVLADAALANRMGEMAQARVHDMNDPARIIDRYLAVYDRLLPAV